MNTISLKKKAKSRCYAKSLTVQDAFQLIKASSCMLLVHVWAVRSKFRYVAMGVVRMYNRMHASQNPNTISIMYSLMI